MPLLLAARWSRSSDRAQFYVVRYKSAKDHSSTPAFHAFQVYNATSLQINALAADEEYAFVVDAANENGSCWGEMLAH